MDWTIWLSVFGTLTKIGMTVVTLVVAIWAARLQVRGVAIPLWGWVILPALIIVTIWAWTGASSAYRPKAEIHAPRYEPKVVEGAVAPPSKPISGENVQPGFRARAQEDQRRMLGDVK